MQLRRTIFLLLIASVLPFAASADEGVLEINQACAEGDGCFAGDTPGFPVEISGSGSYVLTSALDVASSTVGLDLSVGNVTIDLNGFAITGPESCNNTPVTDCTGSGGIDGVRAFDMPAVTVKDGSVTGFSGVGVDLGDRARVLNVRVEENGSNGLSLGTDALVEDVQAIRNGTNGILVNDRSVVRNSVAWGNNTAGIDIDRNGVVVDSTSSQNGGDGILTLEHNTVRGVSVSSNGEEGVVLFNGGGVLTDSTVSNNTGVGVDCSFTGSAVSGVVLNDNNSGGNQWSGSCVETGGNVCEDNTTCP